MSDNVNSQFFSVTMLLMAIDYDSIRILYMYNYILSNIFVIVYFNTYIHLMYMYMFC